MRSMEVPAAVAKIMPIGIWRAQPACQRQPVLARHGDVEDGKVERLPRGERTHCGRVGHRCHIKAIGDEILGDRITQVRLVLDNDNPRAQCGLASAVSGKSIRYEHDVQSDCSSLFLWA